MWLIRGPSGTNYAGPPWPRLFRPLVWLQLEAVRPVVASAGDKPDAHGIAPARQPEAVVLDLVNPIGAGRGLVGWRREAGFNEARPLGGQALTHTLDQHAPNLGGRG